jgi:hypothetical protein
MPLRVNPEPIDRTQGPEPLGPELVAEGLVERQDPSFRLGDAEGLTSLKNWSIFLLIFIGECGNGSCEVGTFS